jgi:hypothetical protein
MPDPSNVHRFRPAPNRQDEGEPPTPTVLGKMVRKDFELWVCLSPGGQLFLKWWRWREDIEQFQPLEDGSLTLDPGDLRSLADLLTSVNNLLNLKARR